MKRVFAAVIMLFAVDAVAWNPFAPKVSYVRLVPAPQNLGPVTKLILVDTRGDEKDLRQFLKTWRAWIESQKHFTLIDARRDSPGLVALAQQPARRKEFMTKVQGDALAGVILEPCDVTQQSEVVEEKKNGAKTSVIKYYYKARCRASFEAVDANDAHIIAGFTVDGEDESAKTSKSLTDWDRDAAAGGALREISLAILRKITPRPERETIVLEKSAPGFNEAMALIKAEKLADARAVWERQLPANESSAALHYDLAAVSEAMGDFAAARTHYDRALALNPGQADYRKTAAMLERKQSDAAALLKKP